MRLFPPPPKNLAFHPSSIILLETSKVKSLNAIKLWDYWLVVDKFHFVFFEHFGVESDKLHVAAGGGVVMSTHLLPIPHGHPTNRLVDLHTNLTNLCLQCLHNKKSVPQQAIQLLKISILNSIHFNNTYCRCTCTVIIGLVLNFFKSIFSAFCKDCRKNNFWTCNCILRDQIPYIVLSTIPLYPILH